MSEHTSWCWNNEDKNRCDCGLVLRGDDVMNKLSPQQLAEIRERHNYVENNFMPTDWTLSEARESQQRGLQLLDHIAALETQLERATEMYVEDCWHCADGSCSKCNAFRREILKQEQES